MFKYENLVHSRLFKLRLSIFKRLSSSSLIRLERVICVLSISNLLCLWFDCYLLFPGLRRCHIDANAYKSNAHQCARVSVNISWQT